MKRLINILIIASFIFLFLYLLKQEYIIPEIRNSFFLGLSFIFLFGGFILSGISWKTALTIHDFECSAGDALVSHGMSIFAKYIPGKIWVIMGRAGYLSSTRKDLKNRSYISFKEQLIYLWAGFLISTIPSMFFYRFHWISFTVFGIIILLTLFLFVKYIHNQILNLIKRLTGKEIDVPLINFRQSLPLIAAVTGIWLLWTLGFYLFMIGLNDRINPVMMFAFPLSVCFGLIAIILPGGLGLREGIIVGYLVMAGLDVESATTISFLNRLWFICGEVFFFVLAWILRLSTKKEK